MQNQLVGEPSVSSRRLLVSPAAAYARCAWQSDCWPGGPPCCCEFRPGVVDLRGGLLQRRLLLAPQVQLSPDAAANSDLQTPLVYPSAAAAFCSGACFSLVSGGITNAAAPPPGMPPAAPQNPLMAAFSAGVVFALFQGGFYKASSCGCVGLQAAAVST